jgi:hypothetical protein
MSRNIVSALMVSGILAASGVAVSARAASPDFCRDYARAATTQYREAAEHRRCADQVQDSARWSPDFRHHFDWCRGVDRDQAQTERDARTQVLNDCARHHD